MVRKYKKGDNRLLYKNFRAYEFDCKGSDCEYTLIDDALVALLQRIRDHFSLPVSISSGYRCKHHNAAVGGGSRSYHMRGQAADIFIVGVEPIEIAKFAESIGTLGIGLYNDFVHVDTRTEKFFWKTHKQIPVSTFGGIREDVFINPMA